MGSIEIFDFKQQKWVPYVPDFEKWTQHFKDIQEGYAKPDRYGRYIVGIGARDRQLKETVLRPQVKLISPVAQALEMAKSELKREREMGTTQHKKTKQRKNGNTKKRKNTETITRNPKKSSKTIPILYGESQLDN